MAEVEPKNEQEPQIEDFLDSPDAEKKEIEFDSLDLKPHVLAETIKTQREIALSADISDAAVAKAVSLPEIMSKHSKRLGLTPDQFARAAANQGLDLGVLVDGLGREGRDSSDVFKALKDAGTVAFKPLEQRKVGMKDIRQKRLVQTRGEQINQLGQKRILSYEKEYDYGVDELAKAQQREVVDFKKVREPSKRQASVAQIVYDMGSSADLSKDQMAAIIANGLAESKLDPFAANKDKEDSHGIWQFNRAGSGEGSKFTVEQLQDPKVQMRHIIDAVKTRDNLVAFNDPDADANELTKQFMVHFEKPSDQSDDEAKKRQAYLKQANRLLDQAAKGSPKEKGIVELDRRKRQEILDRLRGKKGGENKWRLLTDEESTGGDVRNEIAQPGSAAHERYEREVANLVRPEGSTDPERAKMIAGLLAEYSEDDADTLRETFSESAFLKLWDAGVEYDMNVVAQKLGQSRDEFNANVLVEGSKEHKIATEIATINRRHLALYLTTNKLGVPAFVSYEFLDPENKMGEWRPSKDDSYLDRLFHAASRNRVEFVGLDDSGTPVYRTQNHLHALFDKLNLHLSMSSGALERLLNGPEGESFLEAIQEGSISGVKKAQDFTKTLLSTNAAKESGWAALGLGSIGLLVDIFTPDPTFGLAKVAQKSRQGIKKIAPLINKRYVPEALDNMGSAATGMIDTQVLIAKATERFAAGNYEEGRALLTEAKKVVVSAENAEKGVRKRLPFVMREVDKTDGYVAQEIARDVPILTGRQADNLEDTLGFSDFGLHRDYVHPSVERVISRGEADWQPVEYQEFFDISRKIDRLMELSEQIRGGDTAGGYIVKVQREAMGDLAKKISEQLAEREFSRVMSKGQADEVTKTIQDMMAFLGGAEASKLLTHNPAELEARLASYLDALPVSASKRGGIATSRSLADDVYGNLRRVHKVAKKIYDDVGDARAATDLKQELVDVTTSLAAIAEARGAAHSFVRNALAKQEKIKIEPVITAVTNRYDEIGTGKISPVALGFRNELEAAFPAMRGDAAMHIARNLDDRLKAIHRQTGEAVDLIYDTREFKDIIPNLKRKMGAVDDAAEAVDDAAEAVTEAVSEVITDPKFSSMEAFGEEVLTSKEIRDFTEDLAIRLEREDLSDFTAELATKTVKELKQVAKASGIKGYSKLRKSDLIERITQKEKTSLLPSAADEYLRKNPTAVKEHDALREKLLDAQKDFQKAIDDLEALESTKAPTVKDFLKEPSSVIEAALSNSPHASVVDIGGSKFRMFNRDLASAKVRAAKAVRDHRIAELENFTRVIQGRADETISLAEDLDFIPGMIVKVEDGTLNIKSIALPEELQKKGIATALYKIALQRAKKEGLDFASDVNPSPEAQRIYERLIDEGFPIKKVISREVTPEVEALRHQMVEVVAEIRSLVSDPSVVTTPRFQIDADGPNLWWSWNAVNDEYWRLLRGKKTYEEALEAGATTADIDKASRLNTLYYQVNDLAKTPELLAKYGSEPIETVRYIADKGDLAKLSDDVLSAGVGKKTTRPADVTELTDFVEDTQKVVRAMEEAPTVEDFILEISKVARRELNSEQMGAVTKWLAKSGIKVSHRGAVFIADDPAVVVQAEEAFAKAFADYAKGRPPPTTETTSAFEKVKKRVLSSFASAKNAQAEGAKFTPSSEIEQVFDDLLRGEEPLRSGAPNIFKALKRTLLDDLPNKMGDDYLLRIAQESDRLGHPISVKELKKLVTEAAEKQAKNPDLEVTIDLPGPVSLGGLLSPKPKASYTLLDFGRGMVSYAARKELVDNPATRNLALDSQLNAIKELTPTQMIDQYVTTSQPLARWARSAYLGGDALYDMRELPPKVREAVRIGVRMTQQSIGDAVTLISEGGGPKLVRFLTGDPQVKFKTGRNVLSAGHDKMGSATQSLQDYIAAFANQTVRKNGEHVTLLVDRFLAPIGKKIHSDPAKAVKIKEAFDALVFNEGGSTLLKDIFAAAKYEKGDTLEPKHLKILESIFYITGNSMRKGAGAEVALPFVGTSADQFEILYKDINKLFRVVEVGIDEPVANRVTVLIAGHGEATKARLQWAELGIAADAKTADNFKRWIMGESLDDVADYQKVREIFQMHGYNPRFMEAATLEGLNFYVPAAARKKLSMALEQATDEKLKKYSGDMFEAIGKGLKEAASSEQLAMAWTYRYLKTRMVRGHFLLKGRYFWMNTMDHFNQMSQIVGFRPAFISTIRTLPQTLVANPVGQAAIFAAQKVGNDQAGEAMRMALQKAGDKGADWAATLTRASKWRGDLNALLEGRPGYLVVDGIPHSLVDLRRIGVEEGMSASFDTAELGTKIRGAGSMFLEDAKKRGFMRFPGAPTAREWVKVAEDMAEGWAERERYGAMLTLVEMGIEPRKAARLVIDGLYDYAGSMSKADRHWLVQIFFPFWAFQKNANRQLVDVLFSPRGAYRLGVLNRGYRSSTQLLSELLYEDIVDPLGLNTKYMSEEDKEIYGVLQDALSKEFGNIPVSRLPPALRRQLTMAFTGLDSIREAGNVYEIDLYGRQLRKKYRKDLGPHQGFFASKYIEKPAESSVPLYDTKRNVVRVPQVMNEQNMIFQDLLTEADPERTFTSFIIPEQSYIAAANHVGLLTMSIFAMLNQFKETITPDGFPAYLSDADDGGDLFTMKYPLLEVIQPERAMLAADLASVADLNKEAVPYRVAPLIAKMLDQMGIEVLPVDEKEDPFAKKLTYTETMQKFRDGEITVMPEDPFLRGATLEPTKRYYISGGIGALLVKNSIVDELNTVLKKWEKTPHEERAGLQGDLQKLARSWGIVDIRDVVPARTAKGEKYEQPREAGAGIESYQDFVERRNAKYIDVPKKKSKPPPQVDKETQAETEARQRRLGDPGVEAEPVIDIP